MNDDDFLALVKAREQEASGHWSKQGIASVRAKGLSQYLGTYIKEKLIDERYQDTFIDNRQFTSIRTIVPFLMGRITAAEVVPADNKDLSHHFAEDFEKILQRHAEKQRAKGKLRLSVQDLLKGARIGVGKWRYDRMLDTIVYERIKPDAILIGKRSSLFEEPDYLRHTYKRTANSLMQQFPEKKEKIKELFAVDDSIASLAEEFEIKEEWIWVETDKKRQLMVGLRYEDTVFVKTEDPNWDPSGKNVIDSPMMPFVFFNFLSDGDTHMDETSYIEQATQLQINYNSRGQTIEENARYGGIGVPVFGKGAIEAEEARKVRFSPVHRLILKTEDVNKSFSTWQSQPLPQFIIEDKYDSRNSIDNIWGTPNIFRGEQSKNNTLGQDVMIRNQAEGRLSDPIDCIDDSMTRFYQIEAQLMYRYFDDKKFFKYRGKDGEFVHIVLSKKEIAANLDIEISVKAGTSLPIDRSQKRATIMELMQGNKVSTLIAYKELDLFDDPEEAYKQYILEQSDPRASLDEMDKVVFSREANQDLQMVIAGKTPEEREDIDDKYISYLNEWLLTDKYKLLQLNSPNKAAKVSVFIDGIIAKAQRKMDKLAMQAPEQPMPPEGAPEGPGTPGAPGVPPQMPPGAPAQPPMPPQMPPQM